MWLARSGLGTAAPQTVYRRAFEDDRPFAREFKDIQKSEPISRSHEGPMDILQIDGTDEYFYYVMERADAAPGGRGSGQAMDSLTPGAQAEQLL